MTNQALDILDGWRPNDVAPPPADDPRELSGRLTTNTGRFTPHLVRSDYDRSISEVLRGKTRKVGELAEGAAKLGSFGIDYAALEMRVMADLMNKKEGE